MESIQNEMKVINVGEKVPDFKINAYFPDKGDFGEVSFGKIISSGKWLILFFYPADYTFVCPTELMDVAKKYSEIKAEGAELVSLSTDTHFVHLAWQKSETILSDLKYPMGADPTHIVSKTFGVYDHVTGLSFRGTFIINPDGTLVSTEVNYYPVGRNSNELLRKLKAFKHVREHPTEVCPAQWEPGKKTLKPGKDLVGKVGAALGK